jgi:Protein of unknown function (DUF2971)
LNFANIGRAPFISAVSTMLQRRPELDEPDDESVFWRYFPADRFESLIKSSMLYFGRADLYPDQYEGLTPIGTAEAIMSELGQFGGQLIGFRNIFRGRMFVSCWHENTHENSKMWREYAKDGTGVAVKTTAKKVRDSLTFGQSVVFGRVRYIDFKSNPGENDIHQQHLLKDHSFAFEKEARIIYFAGVNGGLASKVAAPCPQSGLKFKISLPKLLGEVVFGSEMAEKREQKIRNLLTARDLGHVSQRKSTLQCIA